MFKSVLPALVLAASLTSHAAAAPAMWRVSDGDSQVWLFGSIHLLDGARNWRTPAFDRALEAADTVWFEMVLDLDAYATLTRLTMVYGHNRDGSRLGDFLTSEQQKVFDEAVAARGLEPTQFDHMQPWMADMTLMSAGLAGEGAPTQQAGVEAVLVSTIPESKLREFESPEAQFRLFASVPIEQQVESLMRTAVGSGMAEGSIGELAEMWMAGDVDRLGQVMNAALGPVDSPLYRRLLADRNRRWTVEIAQLLEDNEAAMIIVGAGHLTGPVGVPSLLRERGFTIERVDRPPSRAPAAGASKPATRR